MKHLFFIGALLISLHSFSQTSVWNNLLQKHVDDNGWVDYDSFTKDKVQLDTYLEYLNNTTPNTSWSANKTKAFWINAYNAYTVKIILDNYPVTSILEINENDKNAWEIPFAKVGGKTYTLNHIEHEILRKQYKDPRIHVGVNCASISCPPLTNTAFTEKNIDNLLTKGIKNFINQGDRNTITESKLELSQIFNWFKDDFTQQGDLITFINQYSTVNVSTNATISYLEYNWNLNKK
ncbi:DUF547 domain-containing protein [Wenyingzhuangia aestuarii]|uniref:DUF547 domain-containing protein n=1 Tax=Wenyingzhuangia aestuarii TaxID=1647582 RepID=UPI00143A2AD5|nr:DUF547 domain-containing protein [Wenyingzhuangia aestuarii]NJB83081.1 hypothetical protein [Wenyingzhuangia aestuarii]